MNPIQQKNPETNEPPSKTVIIADDSPVVRESLVALISGIPQVKLIGQAEFALDAINLVRSLNPDLAVLDISMPDGSGMHVLETIRKFDSPPCIIMLTNFDSDQYRDKCLELGADYFFDKSSEFQRVAEVIEQFEPTR